LDVASNLRPLRSAAPLATDPSPPALSQWERAGGEGEGLKRSRNLDAHVLMSLCLAKGGHRSVVEEKNVRLTEPMIRENGCLRPASWEEALDRAAVAFRTAVEKRGPQTFGIFSCSKTTNELNF